MTAKRFDLYGWRGTRPVDASAQVAQATGIEFRLHDSGYHGGDYYRSLGTEGEEILIQENFCDEEGYLAEPDFPDHGTVMYVNDASEKNARALEAVDGIELLRSEII